LPGFVFDLGGRKLEVIETPGHTAGKIVLLDGSCQSELYKSFAGNAVTCKYGSAVVAFDPKNLRARK